MRIFILSPTVVVQKRYRLGVICLRYVWNDDDPVNLYRQGFLGLD